MPLSEVDVTWSTGDTPAVTHTLTVSANPTEGGTVTVGSTTLAEGATTSISATANSGYVFAGWDFTGTGSSVEDEDEASTTFTMGTSDATLTANFDEVQTYTVTYHANVTGIADIEVIYNEGQDVTVAANTFSNPGYAFTEWNTQADGDGVPYEAGDVIENIQADIDLYAQWEVSYETVDVLDLEFTGRPASTSYGDWSDKEGTSGAVYAGNSAGDKNSIQLRTNNSNSGIITTTSAGNVTKVVVSWHGDTNNQRVLNVYGKNTPYESASDLYNSGTQGELLGTIAKSNQTTLEIDGSYAYIGLRSADGAMYLLEVSITWETGGTPAPSITANNVEIDYDATAGSIAYEINNVPTPAGTLTATTTDTWLTLGTVGETVPFSCSANSAATERTATVTLTYTYGDSQTVTKNVTVTQDGNPDITPTIAEVRAQGTGTVVTKGFVTSITGSNNKTAYIQDATAAIVVYGNFTAAVGDEIRVSGTLSNFNGLLEITSPTVTVLSSGNTINPQVMTIAEIVASENQGWYVRIEDATVTIIDGQNTTIAQDDNTIVVRGITGVEYAVDDVISLNGNIGCYNDVNQIANPQNVEVQQSTEPSITVANATVNVPAEGGEGTLTVTYENITTIVAEVKFYEADGVTEATYDWIVADINSSNNVDYIIDANTGEARSAYLKVYALGNDSQDVYSNLVTINQAAFVVDYATLPFEFDGGRADIATTTGLTQEGLDTDYSSSPKLKFNGTGDWVILKINERPGTLSFDIKGYPSNNVWSGTFKVQTSANGTNYTDLATYTDLTSTIQSEEFDNLDGDIRYIKWIYTNKDAGNVALGNISLAAYDYTPSITLESYSIVVDAAEHDGTLIATYKNIDFTNIPEIKWYESDGVTTATYNWLDAEINATTYNVDYEIGENTTNSERKAYFKVYGLDANVNNVYSGLVTVTQAAPAVAHSITIDNNIEHGTVAADPTSAVAGTLITLTVTPESGYQLASITATEVTSTNVIDLTQSGNNYTFDMPDDNVSVTATFTAIPVGVTYTLVETANDLVPGLHYIIAGKNKGEWFAMGAQNSNNRAAVSITVNDDIATVTSDKVYEFVISGDSDENGWTIYDESTESPGYLYAASSESNHLKTRDNNNDGNSQWEITFDNGVASIVAQGSNTRKVMQFNTSGLFACYGSASQSAVYLYKKVGDTNPVYYSPTEIAVANPDPTSEPIIVVNNEILVLTGNLDKCNNPGNLIVEDGGQLVFSGTGVQATMKKSTAHAGAKDVATDWYTIASPLAANVATNAVGNLTNGTYDLYRYNEATVMWENAKDTEHSGGFNELTVGRGYLYWNGSGSDITFAGELRNDDVAYTLKADGAGNFKGFNLIGNPFSQNITMSNITGVTLSGGYVLTQAGGWGASIDEIAPCQGFLVQVKDETNITISKSIGSKSRANRDYIAFTVANNQYEDVAYAMFSNGLGLDKIDHRNAEIPMVYIPQNGQNYAIATMSDDTEMFNLNFKAMTTGQYTLSFKAQGSYSYLHVIDRITGEDIDMLLDGEYSFIGSPRDNEARFIVKLSYNANIDEIEVNDNFAYQNGSDIIVNGNGELQVFDVNGRMVMNTVINGKQTVNVPTTGLYIFRMIGESVKTQKIVVR